MKINVIKMNLRYSKQVELGTYKTLEIGAEASIDEGSGWEKEYSTLYDVVAKELHDKWNQPILKTESVHKPSDNEATSVDTYNLIPIITTPSITDTKENITDTSIKTNTGDSTTTTDHFCIEHNQPFFRREKDGNEWYSHRREDGFWCKEIFSVE